MLLETDKLQLELPPKPKEPEPHECCGQGCEPCVFDYYERALERWKRKVDKLQEN